jgi:hypothetical protein
MKFVGGGCPLSGHAPSCNSGTLGGCPTAGLGLIEIGPKPAVGHPSRNPGPLAPKCLPACLPGRS